MIEQTSKPLPARDPEKAAVNKHHPVDVESTYARGKLYLLQCRPITTLG